MNRKQQIERHNKNIDEAFEAAKQGQTINLSALIGGAEEILRDDIAGETNRDDACYSDNWRIDGATGGRSCQD